MTRTSSLVFAAAILFSCLSGCGGGGPELGRVKGAVTFDGKPASNIQLRFTPKAGGRPSSATTDSSGNYELVFSPSEKGALIGSHTVSIASPEPLDNVGEGSSEILKDTKIPPEYLKTPKVVEVTAGSNTIDLAYP